MFDTRCSWLKHVYGLPWSFSIITFLWFKSWNMYRTFQPFFIFEFFLYFFVYKIFHTPPAFPTHFLLHVCLLRWRLEISINSDKTKFHGSFHARVYRSGSDLNSLSKYLCENKVASLQWVTRCFDWIPCWLIELIFSMHHNSRHQYGCWKILPRAFVILRSELAEN